MLNSETTSNNLKVPLRIAQSEGKCSVDFGPHPIWLNKPYSVKNVRHVESGKVVKEIPELRYDLVPVDSLPENSMISEETSWLPYDDKSWNEVRNMDCVSIVDDDEGKYIMLKITSPETFGDSEEWKQFKKMLDNRTIERMNNAIQKRVNHS